MTKKLATAGELFCQICYITKRLG